VQGGGGAEDVGDLSLNELFLFLLLLVLAFNKTVILIL
jgi:hypothetical protein